MAKTEKSKKNLKTAKPASKKASKKPAKEAVKGKKVAAKSAKATAAPKAKTKSTAKASPKVKAKNTKSTSKTSAKTSSSLKTKPKDKKKAVVKEKASLLPKNSMKMKAYEPPRPTLIATPTDQMLKPFREAAKRNQSRQKEKAKNQKKTGFLAKPGKSAKKVYMDLRVHSPASEGYLTTGGVDPATAMVKLAKAKGLDMIAVTDYHSAEFIDIIKRCANETSVTIIPGLDLKCSIGSCNEVNLVALFPENYSKQDLDKVLEALNIPSSKRGLRNYTIAMNVKDVIKQIEAQGGCIIPSRLDITPSRIQALHELVESHGFHVFDLAHPDNPDYFKENWPSGEFTFLSFSNATALGQIGARAMPTKLPDGGFSAIKNLASRRQ